METVTKDKKIKTCQKCGKLFETTTKRHCNECYFEARKKCSEKSNAREKAKRRSVGCPSRSRINTDKQAYKEEIKKEPKKSLEQIRLEKRRMEYFSNRGI